MRLTFENLPSRKYNVEEMIPGVSLMERGKSFFRTVCGLAIPVALQSMLQSSFSMVDQVMIGQLGDASIAGVGLAGKFSSIFSVVAAAIGAVAGIMLSQYLGRQDRREVRRSFFLNLGAALLLAAVFTLLCALLPRPILRLYIQDEAAVEEGARYLSILSLTFLPMAGTTLLSALLRCMEKAALPLYAGIAAAVVNTGANYLLIFGKLGLPALGVRGAAIATVLSQLVNFLLALLFLLPCRDVLGRERTGEEKTPFRWKQYAGILLPLLVCEFMWSLGENVYASIYGHMGTDASAAMILINPIQGLMIGALCGLSQAAGVIVGKELGCGNEEAAYQSAKRLLIYGLVGSLALSALLAALRPLYVELYQVESAVKALAGRILLAYALVAPFKVQNMILGGGILRSGGRTRYVMVIDLVGTWLLGVPLGLFSAFVLELPIHWVYFILSLEECARFAMSMAAFRRKTWMRKLE